MTDSEEKIVADALKILSRQLRPAGAVLGSPEVVKQFLTLRLAAKENEVFGVLWLNVKNRLIVAEELFSGTLTHTVVHVREVVTQALSHNAASMICYHNHPSGSAEPSESDRLLTQRLSNALQLVDVRVLDHIIVAGMTSYSFAEHGEI